MKKNQNLCCLILLCLSVTILFSCKKDTNFEGVVEKTLSNAVIVENGYLKFRDQKAFDSLQNIIINYSPQELDNWEKKFNGFKSYRSTYLQAQREYGNVNSSENFKFFKEKYSDIILIRPDSSIAYGFGTPLSATITNNSGELKVGDQFRKYTKENSIILYNGDHKSLSDLKKTANLTILPIKRAIMTVNNAQSLAPPIGVPTFSNGNLSQKLFYSGDNKRRVYIELWYEHTPPPNSVQLGTSRFYFVVLQELKKTFGGWRSNETDYYCHGVDLGFGTDISNPTISNGFNGSFNAIQGVTGPILYNMPSFLGHGTYVGGTARFTTGGVPDAPAISY